MNWLRVILKGGAVRKGRVTTDGTGQRVEKAVQIIPTKSISRLSNLLGIFM
jgi:hypothetical protein